jgi:hypothetical protein
MMPLVTEALGSRNPAPNMRYVTTRNGRPVLPDRRASAAHDTAIAHPAAASRPRGPRRATTRPATPADAAIAAGMGRIVSPAPADGPGEAELMSRGEALAIARDRSLHLIPERSERQGAGPAFCRIGAVSLPVRWEQVPEAEQAGEPDPLLWFEAPCGGRDLLTGNVGTYPGRMSAWCPDKRVSYNVSLAEMGQMSQ